MAGAQPLASIMHHVSSVTGAQAQPTLTTVWTLLPRLLHMELWWVLWLAGAFWIVVALAKASFI